MPGHSPALGRKHQRIEFQGVHQMKMEVDGSPRSLVVADISQGGMGLVATVDSQVRMDAIAIVEIEQVVDLRGRVRWVSSQNAAQDKGRIGIEFESISVRSQGGAEIEARVATWSQATDNEGLFEGFIHILELIDMDIIDGDIHEFSEALIGVAVWLEQQVVPVNLWQIFPKNDEEFDVHLLVDALADRPQDRETSAQRAATVVENRNSASFEGLPFILGDGVIIECLQDPQSKTDILQQLADFLGKRVRIWTKLLAQSIALQLLGDEVQRHRKSDEINIL